MKSLFTSARTALIVVLAAWFTACTSLGPPLKKSYRLGLDATGPKGAVEVRFKQDRNYENLVITINDHTAVKGADAAVVLIKDVPVGEARVNVKTHTKGLESSDETITLQVKAGRTASATFRSPRGQSGGESTVFLIVGAVVVVLGGLLVLAAVN